jgi:hypothetical protein
MALHSFWLAGVAALLASASLVGIPSSTGLVRADIQMVDRTGKADRLLPAGQFEKRVRTIAVRAPSAAGQAANASLPSACEALVSPLADRLLSRQAGLCST